MSDWQLLDTAPRDGTMFETGAQPLHCTSPGQAFIKNGALVQASYPIDSVSMWLVAPTHWRPLPAEPAKESARTERQSK